MDNASLKKKAQQIRKQTYQVIYNAGGGHYGGSLSAVEIMTALYFDVMDIRPDDPAWQGRDRFVLGKGHAGPTLYVILSELGFIDPIRLNELDKDGGSLPKHVDRLKVEGIEYSSGPLGQGLSTACGMATSVKMDGQHSYVYVLLGDGELDEGQVWEAAMTASHYKLNNLIAVVDRNMNQIDGCTEEIMKLEPLEDKWKSFGWAVQIIDGHDVSEIKHSIQTAKKSRDKPSVIIANTVKGKGISFMENQYQWHSGQITPEQYATGLKDLEREQEK